MERARLAELRAFVRDIATNSGALALAALIAIGVLLTMGLPWPGAIGLLAVGCAVAVWSPVAAAAAGPAAAPFIFHPAPIGPMRFSLLELALVLGGIGLGVRTAHSIVRGRGREKIAVLVTPASTTLIALALVAVGAFSLTTVADRHYLPESVREFRVVIVEPVVALFLTRYAIRRGAVHLVVVALIGGGTVVAGVALAQLGLGVGGIVAEDSWRATGPYPHPNNLALYLERVGMVAAGIALLDRRWRLAAGMTALVIGLGLALTLSRGALLALAGGGATIVAVTRPRHGWRWLGAALVLSVVAFAVVAGDRFLASGSAGSVSTRELIWRSSLRMIGDYPLFGVGLDQFLYQYGRRYVEPAGWPERYTSHPHNLVLDVWLRLGVPGLAVFTALGVVLARATLALRRSRAPARGAVQVGAAAALVAGAAHGLVDNGFFLPDLAALTWCFVALVQMPDAS